MLSPVEINLSCDDSVIESDTLEVLEDGYSIDVQAQQFSAPVFQSEQPYLDNQGLNANHKWSGLNFRSKSEIKIAEVLDERGILFFPNIRGRVSLNGRRVNREIDFLICDEGRWGVLECDGEQYHQTAADDHARDMIWNTHGIWFIKRFSATECYKNPTKVVDAFLEMLKRFHIQNLRSNYTPNPD